MNSGSKQSNSIPNYQDCETAGDLKYDALNDK